MRNQQKRVAVVKSKLIIQGRHTVMIPEGGVPVIGAAGNFGFTSGEAAAAVVNFLRCGCPKVQVIFDSASVDVEGRIDEMWKTICQLGDGEGYHFGRLTQKSDESNGQYVDQIIEIRQTGA
jgi:hypothetical protein